MQVGGHIDRRAGRVQFVFAKHHMAEQCGVSNGMAERSNLIERRGKGDQAPSRNATIRRLEPNDARDGCGLPNRSACV